MLEPRGVVKNVTDETVVLCRLDVFAAVIDEQGSFRHETEALNRSLIDCWFRFHRADVSRNDGAVEFAEKLENGGGAVEFFSAPIAKYARAMPACPQAPGDLDGVLETVDEVRPPLPPSFQRQAILRMQFDELPCDVQNRSTLGYCILVGGGEHALKEDAHRITITVKDLQVERLGIPVNENTGKVKQKGVWFRVRHGPEV